MTIQEIATRISGTALAAAESDLRDYHLAFASDLMSDVLTVDCVNLILITGLVNTQTVRTAEMSEVGCIILARNKQPTPEMVALAEESNISLILSSWSVFRICGELFCSGIRPVF
jgi:hypothetical protein